MAEFDLNDLAKQVSETTGFEADQVKETLKEAFKSIAFQIAANPKHTDQARVELHGIGTFNRVLRKSKVVYPIRESSDDPVSVTIPERYKMTFKPSPALLDLLNQSNLVEGINFVQ